MRKVYRNIVKGYSIGNLMAICAQNSKDYNETWFIFGDSGMAGNKKSRKGREQYLAMAYHPDGSQEMVQPFEQPEKIF